jgi:hypothetical protein
MTRQLIDKTGEATDLRNPVRGVVTVIDWRTADQSLVNGLALGEFPQHGSRGELQA